MTLSPIAQTDPRASYQAQAGEIHAAIARVLAGGRYILGQELAGFERGFAAYIGLRHGVGVASGTDALILAVKALGLGAGDVVATVSHTAVATAAAIELAGATPLLLDIDPATYTLSPASLARALEAWPGRIKAVIPVHLYGQAADLESILPLARAHSLKVIEDCAQCHGAMLHGKRLGTWGEVGAFSFYPTKNLGAVGDGGALVTEDDALAAEIRILREYGWRDRYVSAVPGMNSRLDELQAAILAVKLTRLDLDNARRQAIAARYDEGFKDLEVTCPARRPGSTHVFHQYVLRIPERDRVREALTARGIGTLIHYPVPTHLQPAYRHRLPLDPAGLAESEKATREILSLPMHPGLKDGDVTRVIETVREVVREIGRCL